MDGTTMAGQVDFEDAGCTDRNDPEEGDADGLPACADGDDNDGDGMVDYLGTQVVWQPEMMTGQHLSAVQQWHR